MQHPAFTAGASLAGLLLASTTVFAAPVNLQVCSGTTCWNGAYSIKDNVVVDWTAVEALDNTSGVSVDDWEGANGMNLSDWSLSMDSDPFVTNNFSITNTTTSTQTYSLTTTLGVFPTIPNGLMRGSIGFTMTDANNNGATLATSGGSIYTALIDGNLARTLWNAPTIFANTGPTTVGTTSFGYPVFETAPESTDTSIGLKIMFSLTAGDSVAFTNNFEVTPVPVPAALWLFGSGLLGLIGMVKRKIAA
jgi:hypothetical protein